MRVLVTGGAGFLGSHLCDVLIARGDSVVCIDNMSTGRIDNIRHLSRIGSFELLTTDLCDEWDVEGPVEAVAHLEGRVKAGRVCGIAHQLRSPRRCLTTEDGKFSPGWGNHRRVFKRRPFRGDFTWFGVRGPTRTLTT